MFWGVETYSELYQTSKKELFTKLVNGGKPLTNFIKYSILDALQCFWICIWSSSLTTLISHNIQFSQIITPWNRQEYGLSLSLTDFSLRVLWYWIFHRWHIEPSILRYQFRQQCRGVWDSSQTSYPPQPCYSVCVTGW